VERGDGAGIEGYGDESGKEGVELGCERAEEGEHELGAAWKGRNVLVEVGWMVEII